MQKDMMVPLKTKLKVFYMEDKDGFEALKLESKRRQKQLENCEKSGKSQGIF